jgi:hypothetical protein
MKVRTNMQSGAINHNESALQVRTGVQAGGMGLPNHNESALQVRSNS